MSCKEFGYLLDALLLIVAGNSLLVLVAVNSYKCGCEPERLPMTDKNSEVMTDSPACAVKYCNSDFSLSNNSNKLVYTDNNGSIIQITNINELCNSEEEIENENIMESARIEAHVINEDSLRKDIKFYPVDDLVFTTTDINGLKVWDAYAGKCIYKYKEDKLSMHSYSPECILAAFNQFNIKFYDLRCRYHTSSIKKSDVERVGWCDNSLLIFKESGLECFDFQAHKTIWKLQNVCDFAINEKRCYILTNQNKERQIMSIDPRMDPNRAANKLTSYESIVGLKYGEGIVGLDKDRLYFESNNMCRKLITDHKYTNIEAAYNINGRYVISVDGILLKVSQHMLN